MKLPVCSVAMTVDYNKNTQLHDIMLANSAKRNTFFVVNFENKKAFEMQRILITILVKAQRLFQMHVFTG